MPAPKKADEPEALAASEDSPAPEAPAAPPLPAKIRLTHGHGFVDDNKRVRHWKAGEVVSDPHEVALLIERRAPVEVVA